MWKHIESPIFRRVETVSGRPYEFDEVILSRNKTGIKYIYILSFIVSNFRFPKLASIQKLVMPIRLLMTNWTKISQRSQTNDDSKNIYKARRQLIRAINHYEWKASKGLKFILGSPLIHFNHFNPVEQYIRVRTKIYNLA